MVTFYKLIAGGALGLYLASGALGWELGSPERQHIPPSARTSPGGYRSFHFWHTGIHGGK